MGERAARDQIAKSLRFCLPNKALSIAVYTEKKMQKVSEKTAHGLAERGRRQHMRCPEDSDFRTSDCRAISWNRAEPRLLGVDIAEAGHLDVRDRFHKNGSFSQRKQIDRNIFSQIQDLLPG